MPCLPAAGKQSSVVAVPLAAFLRESLAPLVDLVFPPRCPLCGAAIAEQTGLCTPCWATLSIPQQPWCATCQLPLNTASAEEGTQCGACLAAAPAHDGIAAGTIYNEPSRQLVLAFKHGRRIALAPLLGGLIAARLPPLEGEWIIVPVPLYRWRLWQRGYNQAALLARELGRRSGHPLLVDALQRVRRTPALGGLGKRERRKALAGAIRPHPRHKAKLAGSNVLLVDDVLTSGATSEACVRALRQAGAARVVIACFARVIDQPVGQSMQALNETPGA